MALTIDSTKPLDYETFDFKMREIGKVYIDADKWESYIKHFNAIMLKNFYLLDLKYRIYSGKSNSVLDARCSNIQDVLLDLGVPYDDICAGYGDNAKPSMDKKKVILPLVEKIASGKLKPMKNVVIDGQLTAISTRDACLDLLYAYCEYTNYKTITSGGTSKLHSKKKDRMMPTEDFPGDTRNILEQSFTYNIRETGRYYTSNDNIQGYNKKYVTSLTVQKDRYLCWGDLSQIDLRTAIEEFLKTEDNAEIFSKFDDRYKSLVYAMKDALCDEFDEKLFDELRKRYKVYALAKLYRSSTGNLAVPGDEKIIDELGRFYESSPKLIAYEQLAQLYVKLGLSIDIKDYFGAIRCVDSQVENLTSVIINSPIQMTSFSIIIAVSMAIYNKFMELGYKNEDIIFYLNRHDEMLFSMDKCTLKDIWVFKDFETIFIDDWDEVVMKPEFGDYYKEPKDEYMNYYEETWKHKLGENLEYATKKMHTSRKRESYSPLDKPCAVIRPNYDYKTEIYRAMFKVQFLNNIKGIIHNFIKSEVSLSDNFKKSIINFCEMYPMIHPYDREVQLKYWEWVNSDFLSEIEIYLNTFNPNLIQCINAGIELNGTTYFMNLCDGMIFKSKKNISTADIIKQSKEKLVILVNEELPELENVTIVPKNILTENLVPALNNINNLLLEYDKYYQVNTSILYNLITLQ